MAATTASKQMEAVFSDPVFESALSGVAGAVAASGETTQAVLDLPDAALGRVLKERISRFRSLKDTLFASSASETLASGKNEFSRRVSLPGVPKRTRTTGRLDMAKLQADAMGLRQRMVEERQLLDTTTMVKESGFTRQALTKAVDTGRMFTVTVGSKPYYPAFYAYSKADRKVLARVTRALGELPGWTKLDFFESANGAIGGLSPLDALTKGRVDEVLELAEAYADEALDAANAAGPDPHAKVAA